ncbi:DNA cytosine methyltransferase [Streptomyces sp. NPDC001177]
MELCAGAGGLAIGLERAGFDPIALLDTKSDACATLRANRPHWTVLEQDLADFLPSDHPELFCEGTVIDLLAAGLPRLPSAASVMRRDSEREDFLLKATIWLTQAAMPRALLVENIPGLARSEEFASRRRWIEQQLEEIGYRSSWCVLDAFEFGVPQHRLHGFLIALPADKFELFEWPEPPAQPGADIGTVLYASMTERGWPGASRWAEQACAPAPTIVGGSDRRGGADLGPTGSKRKWARLGVDGSGIADEVPGTTDPMDLMPRLTVRQVALLQGFPPDWELLGRKTSSYRQIGNACPPMVASAVGRVLASVLSEPDVSTPAQLTP